MANGLLLHRGPVEQDEHSWVLFRLVNPIGGTVSQVRALAVVGLASRRSLMAKVSSVDVNIG